MSRKQTPEEWRVTVRELVGDEYTFLDDYNGMGVSIRVRHNTCGYEYKIEPKDFKFKGSRCLQCSGTRRKTNAEFVSEVYELVGDEYTFLEDYVNNDTAISCQHNICGEKWEVKPKHFTNTGTRCRHCFYNKKKKTDEEFIKEVYNLVGEEYRVIGRYVNSITKVKVLHSVCNKSFNISPNDFLKGRGCPNCSESKGERAISDYLDRQGVSYVSEKSFTDLYHRDKGRPLRFDYGILDDSGEVSVLIEYDGIQHFEDMWWDNQEENLEARKLRDALKNSYCRENNLKLIRIPYWDYDNIGSILKKEGVIQWKK